LSSRVEWPRQPTWVGVTALLLIALLVAVAGGIVVGSLPPRTLTMAAGEPGGAYHAYALRYRAILAQHGVRLDVLETGGALDNLDRLRDPSSGVSVAFLQSGITSEADAPGLVSLGSVGLEPVWVFYRGDAADVPLLAWSHGERIAIGPPGSGTHKLSRELLDLLGVQTQAVELLDRPLTSAADALLRADIDAMFAVTAFEAPVVQRLLTSPQIRGTGGRRARRTSSASSTSGFHRSNAAT